MYKTAPSIAVLLSILLSACTASSTPPPAPTLASSTTMLANGPAAVPAGQFCIGIANIPQAPGGAITHAHVAGFMFVLAGVHTLQIAGKPDVNSSVGQASFVGDAVTHTHANLQSTPNSWDFIGTRAAGTCANPPPVPGASVVYASPDEPALAQRSYTEQLLQVAMPAGGRTALHTGVTEVFLVLSGSVTFVSNGQSTTLTANQGFIDTADVTGQEIDGGTGSNMLVFVLF